MKQCIYNTQLRLVPETQSMDTSVFTKQLNLDAIPFEGVVFKHPEDHDITIKSRKPTVFSLKKDKKHQSIPTVVNRYLCSYA